LDVWVTCTRTYVWLLLSYNNNVYIYKKYIYLKISSYTNILVCSMHTAISVYKLNKKNILYFKPPIINIIRKVIVFNN